MIPDSFTAFVIPLALVAAGLWVMWRLGYKAGRHDAERAVLRRYRTQSILRML